MMDSVIRAAFLLGQWRQWERSCFASRRLWVRVPSVPVWNFSSVGQSIRLITGRSWVRVPEVPPSHVAQQVEQLAVNQRVAGSNPVVRVIFRKGVRTGVWNKETDKGVLINSDRQSKSILICNMQN